MYILEFFKLAIVSIYTNKVRSLLTMLGIIIGVASVILLVSIGTGLQSFVTEQFASLGSNTIYIFPGRVDFQSGGPTTPVSKFEISDIADLKRQTENIEDVTPLVVSQGRIGYKGELSAVEIQGVWENYFEMQSYPLRLGRHITQNDVERSRKVIVIGAKPVEELFGKNADPIGKYITLSDVRYQIVGVFETKGGGALGGNIDGTTFIPYSTALRQFNQTNPYMIVIQTTSAETADMAAEEAKKTLLKRLKEDDFTVLQQKELLNTINQFLGVITVALGGIASISLLVGGIGIMNIMLVSVTERTREIGLRKAVGATPNEILLQFLIEAIILSLIGGAIGIGLGTLGSLALKSFIQTAVTPWSIFLAFAFSAGVGIIFGVAPAIRAARLNPIDALRYE